MAGSLVPVVIVESHLEVCKGGAIIDLQKCKSTSTLLPASLHPATKRPCLSHLHYMEKFAIE